MQHQTANQLHCVVGLIHDIVASAKLLIVTCFAALQRYSLYCMLCWSLMLLISHLVQETLCFQSAAALGHGCCHPCCCGRPLLVSPLLSLCLALAAACAAPMLIPASLPSGRPKIVQSRPKKSYKPKAWAGGKGDTGPPLKGEGEVHGDDERVS